MRVLCALKRRGTLGGMLTLTEKEKAAIITVLMTACVLVNPCFSSENKYEWVPEEARNGKMDGAYQGNLKATPVAFTKIPKATADESKFTREYRIDLDKFHISCDAANPVETSQGINQALREAQTAGASRIVFPPGTYLIGESNPVVIINKDMIIDLNGATFRINPNGLPKYSIFRFEHGAENVRLTNGRLCGDKESHDYKTVPGTHEWGCGLVFDGGVNLEVDHLTVTNCTGDGIRSNAGLPFKDAKRCLKVVAKNIEQGALSNAGVPEPDALKTRTIKPYELPSEEFNGEFEFGFMFGYMSYPAVMDRYYQACFYDKDMKFLQKKSCIQFKKTEIPEGGKFIHLEFNQPEAKGAEAPSLYGAVLRSRPPTDVHFHDNLLAGNRRLGFGFCGGQRWIIEKNRFEGNGGTAPGCGIDFEDGWDFMQDVVFRNNTFKDNRKGDLVVCAGSEMIFEGNQFEMNVYVWGRTHNYTFRKNHFAGDTGFKTRTGVASMQDNLYEKIQTLSIIFDPKGFNDGFVHAPAKSVETRPLRFERETLNDVKRIKGTYFSFVDCKLTNVHFIANSDTRLVYFKNCEFSDCSIVYEAKGPDIDVMFENCKGEMAESGLGIGRKKCRTTVAK